MEHPQNTDAASLATMLREAADWLDHNPQAQPYDFQVADGRGLRIVEYPLTPDALIDRVRACPGMWERVDYPGSHSLMLEHPVGGSCRYVLCLSHTHASDLVDDGQGGRVWMPLPAIREALDQASLGVTA